MRKTELHEDGSGSPIKFGIRGNNYEFYKHGKKICTVDKGTWDRLMVDNVLPSEIPAMMCKKIERQRSSFKVRHPLAGHDDYHDFGDRKMDDIEIH